MKELQYISSSPFYGDHFVAGTSGVHTIFMPTSYFLIENLDTVIIKVGSRCFKPLLNLCFFVCACVYMF